MTWDRIPYCIWFPEIADSSTYMELAHRGLDVKSQSASACIAIGYQLAFQEINSNYDAALLKEAEANPNPFYLQNLQRKASDHPTREEIYLAPWRFCTTKYTWRPSPTDVLGRIGRQIIATSFDSVYHGLEADFRDIGATIRATEEARQHE